MSLKWKKKTTNTFILYTKQWKWKKEKCIECLNENWFSMVKNVSTSRQNTTIETTPSNAHNNSSGIPRWQPFDAFKTNTRIAWLKMCTHSANALLFLQINQLFRQKMRRSLKNSLSASSERAYIAIPKGVKHINNSKFCAVNGVILNIMVWLVEHKHVCKTN